MTYQTLEPTFFMLVVKDAVQEEPSGRDAEVRYERGQGASMPHLSALLCVHQPRNSLNLIVWRFSQRSLSSSSDWRAGLKVPHSDHLVFLGISPILRLWRGPTLSQLISINFSVIRRDCYGQKNTPITQEPVIKVKYIYIYIYNQKYIIKERKKIRHSSCFSLYGQYFRVTK